MSDTVDSDESSWLHFDYTHPNTKQWLEEKSELDPLVVEALLSEETRPRAVIINDGVLISLRGVNLTPGSNPEDMVAVRIWVDSRRIVSTRKRRLLSAHDMSELIASEKGPTTTGEFIATITDYLISRMQDTVQEIEDEVAQVEERILEAESYALRTEIADLRRQAISLRRYLSPQREAMIQLQSEKIAFFNNDDRVRLRETTDHLIRYIEDLDSSRDRASVTQEELVNRLSEQMNNRMYVLSIVAAIFLPLGFLTGLLGINVGGLPGVENPNAFNIFTVFLITVVALQVWLFKVKRWF
ncbi:MAG: zinc transporter ZntB [Hahellaceae bacterium]|nr:zinc transporter ZntB [Hahellaceae bacterium]